MYTQIPATAAATRAMMKRRAYGMSTPARCTPPTSHEGESTWTLAAPKRSRASCWSTRLTPQVTSNVSRGRPYIRRMRTVSRATPRVPAMTKATGRETRSEVSLPNDPCSR